MFQEYAHKQYNSHLLKAKKKLKNEMSSFFYFSILDANDRKFVTTNDKVDHLDKRCSRDHDDRQIHNNLDLRIFFVRNDLKVEQQHQSQLFPGLPKKILL